MKYMKMGAFYLTYVLAFIIGGLLWDHHPMINDDPVGNWGILSQIREQDRMRSVAFNSIHGQWQECEGDKGSMFAMNDRQYKTIKKLRGELASTKKGGSYLSQTPSASKYLSSCSKSLRRCAKDLAWHERMVAAARMPLSGSTKAWTTVLSLAIMDLDSCRKRRVKDIFWTDKLTVEYRCKSQLGPKGLCADCGAACKNLSICSRSIAECVKYEKRVLR